MALLRARVAPAVRAAAVRGTPLVSVVQVRLGCCREGGGSGTARRTAQSPRRLGPPGRLCDSREAGRRIVRTGCSRRFLVGFEHGLVGCRERTLAHEAA